NTFAWTPTTYGTQNVVATSTGLWLKGSPLGLIASSTFATYSTSTNATSTNFFATLFNAITASTTNLSAANSFGIGTSSPYARFNLHAGATDTYNSNLFIISSSTAAFSTTTLFSIDALGLATIKNLLVTSSSTFQNATSTNLFSTTASSTNLYTALFNGAGLATCQSNNVLTWAGGVFGCEADDNTFAWTPTTYGTQNVVATSTGLWLKGSPLGLIASSTFATYSTSTNATTTNLFSTTASSTNLYSSLLTVGGTGLIVDSSRNVGIGTTTPGEKLEIASGGNLQLSKPLSAANQDIAYVNFNESNIDRDLARITGSSDKTNRAYGRLTFSTMNNATLSERVRIDEDGFVGIGTTSPLANLHVSSSAIMSTVNVDASEALFEGANNSGITIAASDNARANLYFGFPSDDLLHGILTYGPTVASENASDMAIFVNNAERMRFDSTGTVGIGTTTPWGKLSITQTGTGGAPAFIVEDIASPDSSPFIIDQTGNVGIGTTSPAALLSVAANSATQAIFGEGRISGDTSIIVGSAASSNKGLALTYDNDNNYATLYVNGDRALNPFVVADGGNIGIGTTSPIAKLTVEGGNIFHRASTSPSVVGFVTNATTLGDMRFGIAVQGNYAYVTDITNDSLAVIDISSSTPQIVGSVADAVNMDGANGLAVAGNYAYVSSVTADSLTVIDISNPTVPKIVGVVSSATRLDTPMQVAVSGQYVYVANRSDDMVTIVNVSDPTAPVVSGFVSSASLLDFAQGIAVQGKYAYAIGTYSNALAVIDISRTDAPVIVGSLIDTTNLNNAKNIVVSGRYAYTVATTTSTFTIIDVSNPKAPTIAGTLTDTTKLGQINNVGVPVGLAVAGNYAYVGGETGDYFNVIDISNPSRPYFVTSDTDSTRFDGINGIAISGNRAYITSRVDDMFTIININGTETPSLYAGALRSNVLHVDGNGVLGGNLSVYGGISAGLGGIYSGGGIVSYVASSTATNPIAGLFMGGNVGIGTTTPSQLLHIFSTAQIQPTIESTLSSAQTGWNLINDTGSTGLAMMVYGSTYDSGATTYNRANGASLHTTSGDGGAGGIAIAARHSSGVITLHTGGSTERMRIDSSGRVGIGTTTPETNSLLHIFGGTGTVNGGDPALVMIEDDVSTGLTFQTPDGTTQDINFGNVSDGLGARVRWDQSNETLGIGTFTIGGAVVFYRDNESEAMRIASTTGNVGIGTTSPYAKLSLVDNTVVLRDVFVISTTTSGLIFKVDSYGNTKADGAYTSPAADYAEYFYTNSVDLKSGEVVCVDVVENNAIKRCERGADNNVMGIVSTKPSVIGNYIKAVEADASHYAIIGMLGQVDAFVSAENGSINIGDSLTSASSTPGLAMRADGGDSTVGIALEPLATGKGKIKVLISRRNKSLAVEEVETLVVERIANMKIEDQVQQMITQATENLNLDPQMQQIAQDEADKLNALLTIGINDHTEAITKLNTDFGNLNDSNTKILSVLDVSAIATTTPDLQSFAERFFTNILSRVGKWLADSGNGLQVVFAKTISSETVYTKELCIEDVCVTKTELSILLELANSPVPASSSPSTSSGQASSGGTTSTSSPTLEPISAPELESVATSTEPTGTSTETTMTEVEPAPESVLEPAPEPTPEPELILEPAP
ncbi:MAG: hypothetical protein Q7R69_03725, partial [bacterium]|nr:hypothetical protein [bacterium]